MFVTLFVLGGQAMMFITSKLGSIPEIVRSDKISAANGLINMVSMAAIIFGAWAGGWLYSQTVPAGHGRWWLSAAALLGVAACGFITSLFVGRLRPANPVREFPWNPAGQTFRDLRALMSKRPLFLVSLGSAYFWALGSLSQLNIDQFATTHLFVDQKYVGPLLAALTLGIGGGALLAGIVSRGKVELGLVPFGGMGIAVTSMLLATVPGSARGHPAFGAYGTSAALLLTMGITAGLYDIPLQAFLQDRSPPESRGSIMAAYNFLCFLGMLVASGVYWLLSGPAGLPSPHGLLRRRRRHDAGHGLDRPALAVRDNAAVRADADRLHVSRPRRGRRERARAAARCWWRTTSVGPTACCWAWPVRATRG